MLFAAKALAKRKTERAFDNGCNRLMKLKKRLHKRLGGEILQIVDLLPHADVCQGDVQRAADTHGDASLGRAVQFGKGKTGDVQGLVEQGGLGNGILTGGGIQDQKNFMGGLGDFFGDGPFDLLDLFHQVYFRVKPACRIDVNNIHIA